MRLEAKVEQQRIAVSVCDTDNGISADHLGQLFKPFERLGAVPNVEGSSLGLALSKSLLKMMKGNLTVQSQSGLGSRFTLELPFVRLQEYPSLAAAAIDNRSQVPALAAPDIQANILCIEDNLSSLALIETLLQCRPRIKLISSMQGQLGLDLAAQHAPQLILLDLSLPDIDGLNVLQRLRRSAITQNTPVLMITADASDLTRLALQEAGATALTKPVNVPAFLAHLDEYFPEPEHRPAHFDHRRSTPESGPGGPVTCTRTFDQRLEQHAAPTHSGSIQQHRAGSGHSGFAHAGVRRVCGTGTTQPAHPQR